jgi:hypothetical protein
MWSVIGPGVVGVGGNGIGGILVAERVGLCQAVDDSTPIRRQLGLTCGKPGVANVTQGKVDIVVCARCVKNYEDVNERIRVMNSGRMGELKSVSVWTINVWKQA